MTDLFDVLDIGTREESYTSLLAALLAEKPKWAREFFRQSTNSDMPPKPVDIHRQPHITVSGKTAIPDLVLTFGDPASVVWVVEAKIEAREGRDHLSEHESDEARKSLTESLELPEDAEWHYSYMTLEGESPAEAQKFQPASFEPLREVFTKKPSLSKEVYPAYETLRKRLRDYYKARGNKPDPESTLGEYLESGSGLISARSKFYWMGERLAKDLKLHSAFHVTNRGGIPQCQMRDSGWQGPRYIRASETPLKDCYDIHLEIRLYDDNVGLLLHYVTNPLMPHLKSSLSQYNVTEKQYAEYWESRKEFANSLKQHREALEEAGWQLSSSNNASQLARLRTDLPLDITVGEFRKAFRKSAKSMRSAVNDSLDGEQSGKSAPPETEEALN